MVRWVKGDDGGNNDEDNDADSDIYDDAHKIECSTGGWTLGRVTPSNAR